MQCKRIESLRKLPDVAFAFATASAATGDEEGEATQDVPLVENILPQSSNTGHRSPALQQPCLRLSSLTLEDHPNPHLDLILQVRYFQLWGCCLNLFTNTDGH